MAPGSGNKYVPAHAALPVPEQGGNLIWVVLVENIQRRHRVRIFRDHAIQVPEIPLEDFNHLPAHSLGNLHRFPDDRVAGHIPKILEDPHLSDIEISAVDFGVERRPERRRIPGIVHDHVRHAKARRNKPERPRP